MDLTPKQRAFADYYIQFGNATEAAKRAGYKGSNLNRIASENLTKLDIRQYIDERMSEIENKRVADAKEVMEFLTRGMRMEIEEDVLTNDGNIVKKQISAKDAIKCAELIGKRHMMWTDNQNINANVGVTIIDDIE